MNTWDTSNIDHAWIYKSQIQSAIDLITAYAEEYYYAIEHENTTGSESLCGVGADTLFAAIENYLKLLSSMNFLSSGECDSCKKAFKLPEDKIALHQLFLTKKQYGLFVRTDLELLLYRWLKNAGMEAKRREIAGPKVTTWDQDTIASLIEVCLTSAKRSYSYLQGLDEVTISCNNFINPFEMEIHGILDVLETLSILDTDKRLRISEQFESISHQIPGKTALQVSVILFQEYIQDMRKVLEEELVIN